MYRSTLYFFIFACFTLSAQAAITVRAYFDPPKIALGDNARYVVEIEESSTQSMPSPERVTTLPVPTIRGLEFRNGRTSSSQQTRIINMQSEYAITQSLSIDAIPSEVTTYSIPEYTLDYKGTTYSVNSTRLEVVKRSAEAAPSANELIFLKADLPESLYLGQSIQIQLKLYISESVQLRGLNAYERRADGFTLSQKLPEETIERLETINGQRYRVVTWPLQLTPIRSGPQAIDFQFTVSAQLPQNQQSGRDLYGRNSPFGSSLFDNFFGQTEQFNIYTEPATIEVKSLPTEGKPSSFSGAIGDFDMQVFADSNETTVGEPIMLSIKLSGTGNFDRISGPRFPEDANWRHYKPESSFEAKDDYGLRGSKRFDYVFIPQNSGQLSLPGVRFGFFDPETKEYLELTSPPIEVTVAPSKTQVSAPPSVNQTKPNQPSSENSRSNNIPIAISPEAILFTLDYQPKPAKSIDGNPLRQKWFWGINGALVLVSITGYGFICKRRHYRNSPEFALRQSAKSEFRLTLKTARDAINRSDTDAFFRAAQQLIRLQLTIRTGRNLQAAGSAEIAGLLQRAGISDPAQSKLNALSKKADAQRFSGATTAGIGQSEMEASFQMLITHLKALK